MADKTVLVTGAGTGFGNESAFRLADRGLNVNNAGIAEGGSMVDFPGANLRHQFEVNVIGPLLLTQGIAKQMAARHSGKIVFMSSIAGLTVYPFGGAYAASKHALEAAGEALFQELAEFNVEVATTNPGPYLTGFNDRLLDTWQSWDDDPSARLFDYTKLAFPSEQYDPEPVYQAAVDVVTGDMTAYRNVVPDTMVDGLRRHISSVWDRKATDGRGERAESVAAAYDLHPDTAASRQ